MVDERQVALTKRMMALYESHGMSRRHFLKTLSAAGAGVGVSALLAACGSDDTDDAESNDGTTAPSGDDNTPAADAETPGANDTDEDPTEEPPDTTSGGASPKILITGQGQDISNIDPHVATDYSIAATQKSLYDTLLRYKGNPPELLNLLATAYEANEAADEWTFTLDDRAVFHDGTPVTASDVVYSVGRMIRKNRANAWLFADVMDEAGAEAIDDHTVKFTLNLPFSPFAMAMPWLFIANEELVMEHDVDGDEGEAWLLDKEAGSGPFTIKSWSVGDRYEFDAVPDYWHGWPEEGRLAGYIWRIMRESSSRRLALLNGDIHMAGLSPDDFEAMQSEPSLNFISEEKLEIHSLKMNNQRGVTADINVRKAISYAMNYEAILDVFRGRAVLLQGPLPPNNPYANEDMEVYRLDMDKAAEHLSMSEYPDGGFELEYVYVTGLEWEEQIGLILLEGLSQLNIELRMVPLVWPDMVARMSDVETAPNLTAVNVTPSYPDADAYLWGMYHSSQAGTYLAASHYNNPDFDALIEQARQTADDNERQRLYDEAQQILIDDAVEIWAHNAASLQANSKLLGGYDYTPIAGEYFVDYWLSDE